MQCYLFLIFLSLHKQSFITAQSAAVYAAADAKKITALVGLDISAAFDTIDHDVLACRLESQLGVVGAASS